MKYELICDQLPSYGHCQITSLALINGTHSLRVSQENKGLSSGEKGRAVIPEEPSGKGLVLLPQGWSNTGTGLSKVLVKLFILGDVKTQLDKVLSDLLELTLH